MLLLRCNHSASLLSASGIHDIIDDTKVWKGDNLFCRITWSLIFQYSTTWFRKTCLKWQLHHDREKVRQVTAHRERIREAKDDFGRQTGNKSALCREFRQKKHIKQLFPNFLWCEIAGTGWTCAEMQSMSRKFCRWGALKLVTQIQFLPWKKEKNF